MLVLDCIGACCLKHSGAFLVFVVVVVVVLNYPQEYCKHVGFRVFLEEAAVKHTGFETFSDAVEVVRAHAIDGRLFLFIVLCRLECLLS